MFGGWCGWSFTGPALPPKTHTQPLNKESDQHLLCPKQLVVKKSDNPKLSSTKQLAKNLQKYQSHESQRKLGGCSRLKETKETGQLNTTCVPGWGRRPRKR